MPIAKTLNIPFGSFSFGELRVVPFRAFEAAVQDIKRLYPDEAEQKTCMVTVTVHGCTISHTLTPAEEAAALQAQIDAIIAAAAAALPREGEPMTVQQVAALRRALGLATGGAPPVGTPAAPPGEGHTYGPSDVTIAAPQDRRQVYLNWFVQSGWTLPDHLVQVYFGNRQQRVTDEESEEWLNLTPGTFAQLARERGLKG